MATYVIGDLQGCFGPLQRLLAEVDYDPAEDVLWFVGDLVNRGPDSLETLRFVKELGSRAVTVLGNHDLHLLCVAEGFAKVHPSDTLQPILTAPDRDELLEWLRHQPLLHRARHAIMVHAGLLPQWSFDQAEQLAREVEVALRADDYRDLLAHLYGNEPHCWRDELHGIDRLRIITNVLTRLRICSMEGDLELRHKGMVEEIPSGYLPWFEVPTQRAPTELILCGHWSAVGLKVEKSFVCLDTGCLWGRALSAFRLEDHRIFQIDCGGEPLGSD